MATIGGCVLIQPTPSATVSVAIPIDARDVVAKWTAGENETINLTGTQKTGQSLTLLIGNDALARTLTLGTGLVSLGVVVGTALKTAVLSFRSDGTSFYEVSRTLGL